MARTGSSLLPERIQEEIADKCQRWRVTVVCGDTGCGKSTQVPQVLLDRALAASPSAARRSILCSQPRRLAAVSIAKRVAQERGSPLGTEVSRAVLPSPPFFCPPPPPRPACRNARAMPFPTAAEG